MYALFDNNNKQKYVSKNNPKNISIQKNSYIKKKIMNKKILTELIDSTFPPELKLLLDMVVVSLNKKAMIIIIL